MTGQRRVFDAGLQPERTALAWRRTALALLVGSVVGARLLADAWGWAALALGAVGVATAAGVWVASARRSRRVTALLLRDGDPARSGGAWLHLALAVACCCAGVLALVLALSSRG